MNALSEVLDRPEPALAVVFTEPLEQDAISKIATLADVAEFRADLFPSNEPSFLVDQTRRLAILPLLATVRLEAEGGLWDGSEEQRLDLFSKLLPQIDGLDIELGANILPDVIEVAHSEDKIAVASTHNFETTPSLYKLEERLATGLEAGADYVKFASRANTHKEYARLAGFTLKHASDGLIVVAMGKYGPLSRITLPRTGSRMTYAFSGKSAVVPGQLGYEETRELLNGHRRSEQQSSELNPRDILNLELISMGYDVRMMAEAVFLSQKTVRNYRSDLLSKLGAQNTAHAVRIGFEKGHLKPTTGPRGNYGLNKLSETELIDLEIASQGFYSREAAVLRGVSYKTVTNIRSRILRKLGASNMSGAVGTAIELGIIEV